MKPASRLRAYSIVLPGVWTCVALAQVPKAPERVPGSPPPAAPAVAPRVPADPLTPDVRFWRERIRLQVQQQLKLPPSVPAEAHVELDVAVLPSGQAVDITAREASRFPELEMIVRRAVLAATPLELPADPIGYERVSRFGVVFDLAGGLRVVEPQPLATPGVPAAAPASEPFLCSAASISAAKAPDCARSGSRNDLLTCYAQAVRRQVVKLVSACGSAVYPVQARKDHWEGTVQVVVTFDRGGKPSGVVVGESSGQPALDQRAVDLVREGLVPTPVELLATPFAVRVPVIFKLQRPEGPRTPSKEM